MTLSQFFMRGLTAGTIAFMILPNFSRTATSSATGLLSTGVVSSKPVQNGVARPLPTVTPTLPVQNTVVVHVQPDAAPTHEFLTPTAVTETAAILPLEVTLHLPRSIQLPQPRAITPPNTPTDVVDNWELLMGEDFEGDFPQGLPCTAFDNSNDGLQRFWDEDDFKPRNGSQAGWPAKGGNQGLDPQFNNYPANMNTWIYCGPFDLSQAQKLLVRFGEWRQLGDGEDRMFVGASYDGSQFYGLGYYGTTGYWTQQNVWFTGFAGDNSVWVAWNFESDGDAAVAQGSWLDDLEVWRYNTPAQTCGDLDPGNKGVILNPYEWVKNLEVPTIRAGDTLAVDALVAADARWVRLGFQQKGGIVNLQDYDRMVDTLCVAGISVLGLVNHQTLVRQDFNNVGAAIAYRLEFTQTASFIASHFQDRIKYWEIWNEENYAADGNVEPPYVAPMLYAPLLNDTYTAIRQVNPSAKVIFGGLNSAFDPSNQYLADVYVQLNTQLGGARPFDILALHPYFASIYDLDPGVYMYQWQELDPGDVTIIDKFVTTMNNNSDFNKDIWVTEIGWNSAKGDPNVGCLANEVVTAWQQALYLKSSFDILFGQAPRVKKIFWYQYLDVGDPNVCPAINGATTTTNLLGRHASVDGDFQPANSATAYPWWFGLYQGDKTTPKPAQCAFAAYPQVCRFFFLPIARR